MTTIVARFLALNESDLPDEAFARAMVQEASAAKQSVGELADHLSTSLADAFINDHVAYDSAGCLIDSVYRALLLPSIQVLEAIPAVTLEVYEAFDRGEYLDPEHDAESDDPVEKYTKPVLKALLQRMSV